MASNIDCTGSSLRNSSPLLSKSLYRNVCYVVVTCYTARRSDQCPGCILKHVTDNYRSSLQCVLWLLEYKKPWFIKYCYFINCASAINIFHLTLNSLPCPFITQSGKLLPHVAEQMAAGRSDKTDNVRIT